ncbi:MAG TPA: NrfD/PsrC family molybdoenzyme membrane anchor subunit [Kiloniellales bacterium]|nr:NrfD/PsrC family molybdoenzyme membrane anchor subunit [Kiloniellales bacterium]
MSDGRKRDIPTYHDLPALNTPHWDWRVSAYIFAAGLGGATQLLSTATELLPHREGLSIRRKGRYLSLLSALVSAPLLIWDLQTPRRFYNMLRIFRITSPMSFGSYLLSGFGVFSGLTAVGQWTADHGFRPGGRLAQLAQWPAALMGAGMSCYTGALLSATSNPLWAAAPRLLAARLAASSLAMGAASLSLGERLTGKRRSSRRLDAVAALASTAGLLFSLLSSRTYRQRGVEGALEEKDIAKQEQAALVLSHGIPLACYAIDRLAGRRSDTLSIIASLSVVAGGYVTRDALLKGGRRSSQRPRDYFSFAGRHRE